MGPNYLSRQHDEYYRHIELMKQQQAQENYNRRMSAAHPVTEADNRQTEVKPTCNRKLLLV